MQQLFARELSIAILVDKGEDLLQLLHLFIRQCRVTCQGVRQAYEPKKT